LLEEFGVEYRVRFDSLPGFYLLHHLQEIGRRGFHVYLDHGERSLGCGFDFFR